MISSLYVNYIFQGIAAIVISQNMAIFQERWQASLSQVTLVISAIGLGRILFLNLSGYISDKIGRKLVVLIGGVSYMLFFLGTLLATSYWQAFLVALFAGCGNAFLDTSTYPTLVEAFPTENDNSALSVLNKAFISVGQFVFPIVTRWALQQNIFFGWTILVCVLGLFLNTILLSRMAFPVNRDKQKLSQSETSLQDCPSLKSKFQVEGIALLTFSFVSVSLFNIFILWIPSFSEQMLSVSNSNSLLFVSVYSACSFISVFVTSFIVEKKVDIPNLMLLCVALTALALLYMILMPSLASVMFASVAVGLFSAGGIWQLGLALILEFFPSNKGMVTSFYSLATAISLMLTPYITGLLAENSISGVFAYNVVLACLGLIALLIVKHRYRIVVHRS